MTQAANAQRNLTLYPWYVASISFFAWMPVFFLFFLSKVEFGHVLMLGSVYYMSVVLLEVPSGYFSDRFGRRLTLILAAAALSLAYGVFCFSSELWHLVLGQVLLAGGIALNSGTDTSFHLANLQALNREEEYGEREAKISSITFGITAAAAICGGALASTELVYAYVLSGVASLTGFAIALAFKPVIEVDSASPHWIGESLRRCVGAMREAPLGWLFAAVVVATVANHIPYEFYQPYLDSLKSEAWATNTTPLIAGFHMATVMLIAMPMARKSGWFARRFGLTRLVIATIGAQVVLAFLMASFESWVIALFMVFRSVPRALQDAPIRAAVAPRLPVDIRVTYLSLQSLTGRLGFSVLLGVLSFSVFEGLAQVLMAATIVSSLLLLGLAFRAPRTGD